MNENSSTQRDDEPIMQTVSEPLQQILQRAVTAKSKPKAPAKPQTMLFRPVNRQPLAMLTVLDDGSREQGETIRIRSSRFAIGREKGDVTIPFDTDISGTHAELRCQRQKGKFRWFLIDSGSRNGTFLRIYRASLSREMELLLGSRRYLFQLPEHRDEEQETKALRTQAFEAPSRAMMEQLLPRLVETGIDPDEARSFSISGGETVIGAESSCQIPIDNDPFLSPKHARFYQDERGRWMIDDRKSHNGVWIRVKRMALDQSAEFQIGQQRFRFQPKIS